MGRDICPCRRDIPGHSRLSRWRFMALRSCLTSAGLGYAPLRSFIAGTFFAQVSGVQMQKPRSFRGFVSANAALPTGDDLYTLCIGGLYIPVFIPSVNLCWVSLSRSAPSRCGRKPISPSCRHSHHRGFSFRRTGRRIVGCVISSPGYFGGGGRGASVSARSVAGRAISCGSTRITLRRRASARGAVHLDAASSSKSCWPADAVFPRLAGGSRPPSSASTGVAGRHPAQGVVAAAHAASPRGAGSHHPAAPSRGGSVLLGRIPRPARCSPVQNRGHRCGVRQHGASLARPWVPAASASDRLLTPRAVPTSA